MLVNGLHFRVCHTGLAFTHSLTRSYTNHTQCCKTCNIGPVSSVRVSVVDVQKCQRHHLKEPYIIIATMSAVVDAFPVLQSGSSSAPCRGNPSLVTLAHCVHLNAENTQSALLRLSVPAKPLKSASDAASPRHSWRTHLCVSELGLVGGRGYCVRQDSSSQTDAD